MRKRSPYAYFADQAYSFGPDDLSYQLGSCCATCKGTASLFVDPVKHGIPVVSEDDY
jgi:hypothetical protein